MEEEGKRKKGRKKRRDLSTKCTQSFIRNNEEIIKRRLNKGSGEKKSGPSDPSEKIERNLLNAEVPRMGERIINLFYLLYLF